MKSPLTRAFVPNKIINFSMENTGHSCLGSQRTTNNRKGKGWSR